MTKTKQPRSGSYIGTTPGDDFHRLMGPVRDRVNTVNSVLRDLGLRSRVRLRVRGRVPRADLSRYRRGRDRCHGLKHECQRYDVYLDFKNHFLKEDSRGWYKSGFELSRSPDDKRLIRALRLLLPQRECWAKPAG